MRAILTAATVTLALCASALASLQYSQYSWDSKAPVVAQHSSEESFGQTEVAQGELVLVEVVYDAGRKCLELTFDRPVIDELANTWGVVGISADEGRTSTIWLKTPWTVLEASSSDRKACIAVDPAQAQVLDALAGEAGLSIQVGSCIFKAVDNGQGNFSVSFLENVRVFVKPAPTGLRK